MYVFGHRLPPRVELRNERLGDDKSAGCQTSDCQLPDDCEAWWWWFKLLSTVHLSWNEAITNPLFLLIYSSGHAVIMCQRLLHWDTMRLFFFVFVCLFYLCIQASSTQINYLHVQLIPWRFHRAALGLSLPRPLRCSYTWFWTTDLLLCCML